MSEAEFTDVVLNEVTEFIRGHGFQPTLQDLQELLESRTGRRIRRIEINIALSRLIMSGDLTTGKGLWGRTYYPVDRTRGETL